MSKKIEGFPFYINYLDVDEYCFWLLDAYGEDSEIVKIIDANDFMDKSDNPQKYRINADELLLEIRQFLIDNGFEKEIAVCDKAFAEERKNRGKKNPYIPMHKRWETDEKTNLNRE